MIVFQNLGRLGRMCNQMFSIMGTIAIASRSQQAFGFPVWRNHDARDRFGSSEDIDLYKHFVNQLPEIPEGLQFKDIQYKWGWQDLYLPSGNWNLNSHFQCPAYFEECPDLIKHYFTMVEEPGDIDAVAIHVRRGDYSAEWHPLQDRFYYQQALGHVPPTTILLFSDDLNAASEIMDNIGIDYTPVDKDGIESFKIMKSCRHFITANSSYSLMASILGTYPGKRIVCPKNWFGPNWEDPIGMTQNIYPHNAVVL